MKRFMILTTSALALAGAAFANESDIDQNGSDNTATVNQSGGNEGLATINQGATGNGPTTDSEASIVQSESGGPSSPNFGIASNDGTINQTGTDMSAKIKQNAYDGTGQTNTAVINQASNGAIATTNGFSQEASVNQNGEGNDALVNQGITNAFPPPNRSGQEIAVKQEGDFNQSTNDQRGNSSFCPATSIRNE